MEVLVVDNQRVVEAFKQIADLLKQFAESMIETIKKIHEQFHKKKGSKDSRDGWTLPLTIMTPSQVNIRIPPIVRIRNTC